MRVELWVVRHGAAEERGPRWPSDAERPLTAKGERQARRLRTVMPSLDRLFASPKVRAAQTAAPLVKLARDGAETLPALADGETAELASAIERALVQGRRPDGRLLRAAIVGHEPQLSEAIGLWIAGEGDALPASVRMRKGSVAKLVGTLREGGMRLELLLPQAELKRLG